VGGAKGSFPLASVGEGWRCAKQDLVNGNVDDLSDSTDSDLMTQNIVLVGGISVARGRDRHRWRDRPVLPCSTRVPVQKDVVSVTLEWVTTVIGSVEGETHPWQRSARNHGR
jgi:hypothetical protein